MANLKPYKFTPEDARKGGIRSGQKKIENKLLADKMLPYFTGEPPYDQGNDFVADFMQLDPKERLQFTASVLKYLMPVLQSSTVDQIMNISGSIEMSVEERKDRIKEILMKAS